MRIPARVIHTSHALVAGLFFAAGGQVNAQGTIRGVLVDSLRSGAPLARAEVVLVGTGRREVTDRQGRFTFRDVPEGRHAVAYWATWLDSAALPAIEASATVTAREEAAVTLHTPSRAVWLAALCDRPAAPGETVLHGDVRGTDGVPLAGVRVEARWMETRIGAGVLERADRAAEVRSDSAGRYVLCGLPESTSIGLGFALPGDSLVSALGAALGNAVQRRDFLADPQGGSVRIRGRVLGARGAAVAGASVAVDGIGAESGGVRTGQDGRFSLIAAARSAQLLARAVGLVPASVDIEPYEEAIDLGDIRLEPVPPMLAAMMVSGRRVTREEMEFEERRLVGMGGFVTEETLKRAPVITPSFVASFVSIARTVPGPYGKRAIGLWKGAGPCAPLFFIDGYPHGRLDALDQELYIKHAKRVEVYRAAFAPARFADFGDCGSVVIWTR